ncbi:hypothetical protein B566_EDAN000885 [Ephemera danica]|nr:hypothetical protein B566_EDAN000885 [Ephemera danica]
MSILSSICWSFFFTAVGSPVALQLRGTEILCREMERWSGRVVIVTGASAGMGAALCRRLAERGMRVVGVARRVERVQALAKEAKGEIHAVQGDVTKEEDVVRAVKWTRENLGGADVLINNAGMIQTSPLLSGTTEQWKQQLDVNVLGVCIFTREVIKDMRDRGVDDGHIVHINSVMGHRIYSFAGLYLYSAAKHAVTVLAEGLRRELSELGSHIRITSVSPALVKTEIMIASGATQEQSDEFYKNTPSLDPINVVEAIEYALGAPASVDVEEITLRVTCSKE